MKTLRFEVLAALVMVVGLGSGPRPSLAQDPAKKDEALEKLLEKLDDPKPAAPGATPADDPTRKPDPKPAPTAAPGKKDDALEKLLEKLDGPKPPEPAKPAGGAVGSKDQSLDKLLEGLGGTSDKPSPDDKKPPGGEGGTPPGDPPPPTPGGENTKPNPLDDASKQLDDLLEEKTGRKPKPKPKQGQGQGRQGGAGADGEGGSGPLGDLIKQMRDVEDRLGKPDTGAETRQKQTEIVKNLDTLLEQMKNSSSQSQAMKLIKGGSKPGGPPQPGPGNQPGATGQGVGLSKPTPPKTPQAPVELAKEVWGQLPTQFRDDMANVLNERALPSKAEMIRLYYLSLGKKTTAKGD